MCEPQHQIAPTQTQYHQSNSGRSPIWSHLALLKSLNDRLFASPPRKSTPILVHSSSKSEKKEKRLQTDQLLLQRTRDAVRLAGGLYSRKGSTTDRPNINVVRECLALLFPSLWPLAYIGFVPEFRDEIES